MNQGYPQMQLISLRASSLAQQVANAFDHLNAERRIVDGYTGGSDGIRSTDPTTTVERAIIELEHLDGLHADLTAEIKACIALLGDISHSCDRIIGYRVPVNRPDSPRCTADPGMDGYNLPRSEGGWHDPLCTNVPRSASGGLCNTCRVRLDRYRADRPKLKPATDERTVTHDCVIREGQLGCVHALPIQGAA